MDKTLATITSLAHSQPQPQEPPRDPRERSPERPPQPTRHALFSVGQVVSHQLFGYRGVVVDVDPVFRVTRSDRQYRDFHPSRKDRPWYHILVHDSDRRTYVAEEHLTLDPSGQPVDHPQIPNLFRSFADGVYQVRGLWN